MFEGVEHIGIAVKNLDDAISVYRDVLGFELDSICLLTERRVRVAFVSTGGKTKIELLEPLDNESPVAKFLESRGEGIHHFAVKVKNIERAIEEYKQKGVMLVDDKPRQGAEGKKIAFVHPKSTKGVLLELME